MESNTRLDETPSTLAVALHVAAHWPGARVFPVEGKHPAHAAGVGSWNVKATRDPEQIVAWWAGTDYGIGVTGILAIDGDDLGATIAAFPPSLTSGVTISGNPRRRTFLFQQPTDPFTDGRHAGGEIKGSGYVVLPPSPHLTTNDDCDDCKAGPHGYRWLTDWADLPVLPDDLAETIPAKRASDRPTLTLVADSDERLRDWMTDGEPCPAVERALEPPLTTLASGGGKYPTITGPLVSLLRLGEQGHRGVRQAVTTLHSMYVAACADESPRRGQQARAEWARSLHGVPTQIVSAGLTDLLDKGCCSTKVEPVEVVDPETGEIQTLEDLVFSEANSPLLWRIREHARALRVGPWAVLGSAMARAVAEVSPHVVLPAYVGGYGSLNLYVALVDSSGAGKSTGHKAAGSLFSGGMTLARHVPNGTGEGLTASFLERTPKADIEAGDDKMRIHGNPRVLMYVDEIGQLQSSSARSGSTIDSTLRSMWNGELTGNNNANPDLRRTLPGHSYRLSLVAGVQPGLAGAMLSSQAMASGSAQRWLWLPVTDPDAPDVRPVAPAPMPWEIDLGAPGAWVVITFPPHVETEVQAARLITLRGQGTEDDKIKAHGMLVQMKVAAALAVLHGTIHVDDGLWATAGLIMRRSDVTREKVITGLALAAEREAEGRGWADAARERGRKGVEAGLVEKVAGRLARRVLSHAEADGGRHAPDAGCTRSCLTLAVSGKDRHLLDEAISLAVDIEWIEVDGGRYRGGRSVPA